MIGVVTTREGLAALEPAWNELLRSSEANSIFLTWEWITTWWQFYGNRRALHIVVVRAKDGAIVGLAPLCRAQHRFLLSWQTISFIGAGGDVTPEYLDFIVRRGYEQPVVRAIVEHLLADPTIDELDLLPFASASPNLAQTLDILRAAKGTVRHRHGPRCPILPLPSSPEEFLATRSKNYKKKVGEYQRRCEKRLNVRLRQAVTADEVRRDLATLRTFHGTHLKGRSRAFRSAQYMGFHETFATRLLSSNALRIYALESDSRTLALVYGFIYEGRYYFYQGGRDPAFVAERVGLVLMHKVIQEAIRDGAKVFDFLTGEEDYKYRWAVSADGSDRITHWKTQLVLMMALGRRTVRGLRHLATPNSVSSLSPPADGPERRARRRASGGHSY